MNLLNPMSQFMPPRFLKSKKKQTPFVIRLVSWLVHHWKMCLGIIVLILTICQTAGFAAFITEEGDQQLGFGVFTYQQAKQWEPMREAILVCMSWAKRHLRRMKILNVFNPITGHIFVDYEQANLRKLEWQLDSVNRRLGEVEDEIEIINNKLENTAPSPIVKLAGEIQPLPAPKMEKVLQPKIRPVRQLDRPQKPTPTKKVYITTYGKRYHSKDCGSIKGKKVREVTIPQAKAMGMTPCRRRGCNPDG